MASDDWRTSGATLRLTATGTLVGMPALRPTGCAALDPQRWSQPPPPGTEPIVPYDGPEDETSEVLTPPWRLERSRAKARLEPEPLPWLPMRRVMPAEERRLLERAAIISAIIVCGIALACTLLV